MSTVLHLRLLVDGDLYPADETGERIAAHLAATAGVVGPLRAGVRYLGGMTTRPEPTPKVSIHPHTYRDKAGFSVRSSRGPSIFVETRSAAEKIKARMLAGEDERMSDYQP